MRQFINQLWISRDIPSFIFLTVIAVPALWLIALPLSTKVQETYLRRFHLANSDFSTWAIQQTVPSMYNFENKYWFNGQPIQKDQLDQIANEETRIIDPKQKAESEIKSNMVNHFPTRIATFADQRRLLKKNPRGFFYFRSRYRGREIKTTFKIEPGTESEFALRRVETSFE